jgi:hypothetical protein
MVEVIRPVGGDALPSFVPSLLGDGKENNVKGWRGRNGPPQRCRIGIVFDDNFVANAHMIQTR